jgi:hypothetical protein
VVNRSVVTAIGVDHRFEEGAAGWYLRPAPAAGPCSAAVDWAQVRAVLPDPGPAARPGGDG